MAGKGLQFGGIYRKFDNPRIFAKVESFEVKNDTNYVLFALWDRDEPGWQGGASLERELFEDIYNEGPVEGWDNESPDPEYHELDHNCDICR